MDPVTAPMWLEALRVSPGIAGMAWLGYLAYRRSHDAEVHVQTISDKFLDHLERKDDQLSGLIDQVIKK